MKIIHYILNRFSNLLSALGVVFLYILALTPFSFGAMETVGGDYLSLIFWVIIFFVGTALTLFLEILVANRLQSQGITVVSNTIKSIFKFDVAILAFVVLMTVLSYLVFTPR